ncbi:hypothetical protein N7471_009050 [Penicillium samsonianum]|uniref:uncharacterized protein n=1 Tax=Penicillium samsonianum TaxID=1882272 RepID=UPI0025487488|nr:uncharacterized protein N7471_009050 [Penicillium samsonianum]KAJ6127833.1 hypothetical protein N7471_009050 [Penicillium samsonianum]
MSYKDVLPSIAKYEFKGIQDCLQILDQKQEQYEKNMDSFPYVFFTIDERAFLDCFENSEERELRKSWEFYDPSIKLLLVKIMESGPHATATAAFTQIFLTWRGPFDPNRPLVSTATNIFRGSLNKKKKADCSWTPAHPGLNRKWPTIAVEVAWSEPGWKLIQDVEFWLNQCHGQVNIVLTINICERGRILIRQWRSGARGPVQVQKIEITKDPAPKTEKIQGSMKLPFEQIHLRPKGPNETDFIISHQDMENLAAEVWASQRLDEST